MRGGFGITMSKKIHKEVWRIFLDKCWVEYQDEINTCFFHTPIHLLRGRIIELVNPKCPKCIEENG
jgi:hypothetical protein